MILAGNFRFVKRGNVAASYNDNSIIDMIACRVSKHGEIVPEMQDQVPLRFDVNPC